ncbi:hypothetical protein ACJJTC_007788 [Scirpophaga incertulas]
MQSKFPSCFSGDKFAPKSPRATRASRCRFHPLSVMKQDSLLVLARREGRLLRQKDLEVIREKSNNLKPRGPLSGAKAEQLSSRDDGQPGEKPEGVSSTKIGPVTTEIRKNCTGAKPVGLSPKQRYIRTGVTHGNNSEPKQAGDRPNFKKFAAFRPFWFFGQKIEYRVSRRALVGESCGFRRRALYTLLYRGSGVGRPFGKIWKPITLDLLIRFKRGLGIKYWDRSLKPIRGEGVVIGNKKFWRPGDLAIGEPITPDPGVLEEGGFLVNCPPASSVGSRRFRAVSVVAKNHPRETGSRGRARRALHESPRTGGLGLIVREISGFNQIEYKFGGWLSRELLGLGGPSLGSLGRAWGELPGWVG